VTDPFPALASLRKHRALRGIELRPETDEDQTFFSLIFGLDRAPMFAALPADLRQRLLESQFALQRAHFQENFADADFLAIVRRSAAGEQPIGRLYIQRRAREWYLIDILLHPAAQGQGTGAALIGWMQAHAPAVDLKVARENWRAEALYARLGFREAFGSAETHKRMRWHRSSSTRLP
jgi:ribosomal protein S18 acetylase RimI-like enzyme